MSETERKALVEQLRGILPLLDGLEVGQDCADYSYAKAGGFQAMTYCPDAFEALRCVPEAIARIAALEAENARKDEDLRGLEWFSTKRRLSLSHYSPMRGDDDDEAIEWRVYLESGPINDREWEIVGRGETALEAVAAARAALEARND